MSENVIASEVFLGDEAALFGALIAAMKTGSVTDQKNASKLEKVSDFDYRDLSILEDVCLIKKTPFSAKIGSIPTKKLQSEYPDLTEKLNKLMARVEEARPKRLALANARRSLALWRFGHAFVKRYENQKQQLGWLDFDDLILRARDLLNDPAVAAWVLYRLDGGIDHILVDEAQDTSPEQWQVIERLAQEFTSGEGAHDAEHPRTIFVVGDKKQSIYSFQGQTLPSLIVCAKSSRRGWMARKRHCRNPNSNIRSGRPMQSFGWSMNASSCARTQILNSTLPLTATCRGGSIYGQ